MRNVIARFDLKDSSENREPLKYDALQRLFLDFGVFLEYMGQDSRNFCRFRVLGVHNKDIRDISQEIAILLTLTCGERYDSNEEDSLVLRVCSERNPDMATVNEMMQEFADDICDSLELNEFKWEGNSSFPHLLKAIAA